MKSVILVGGGYSILEEGLVLDLWNKIKGQEIWSLNFAYKTMPYLPTRELWLDKSFFKHQVEELQNLHLQGVQLHARYFDIYAQIPEIKTYQITRDEKEFDNAIYITGLGQVGPFGLSIAIKEKYDVIYLLGYDFGTKSPTDKQTHYYQDTHKVLSSGFRRPDIYLLPNGSPVNEIKTFEIFNKKHDNIWNVSLRSNLPYFPKISYQEFFKKLNDPLT